MPHGHKLMRVEGRGVPRPPGGHLQPCRLAARVEPVRAAPPVLNVRRLRHGAGRRTLGFEPAPQPLGQIVGQAGDLDAGGHLTRTFHHVDGHPLAVGAMFDAGGGLRRGEALVLEGQRRLVGDCREERLAGGQGTAEQQEFVVCQQRACELCRVEVREPAHDDPLVGGRLSARCSSRGLDRDRVGHRHEQRDRHAHGACETAGGSTRREQGRHRGIAAGGRRGLRAREASDCPVERKRQLWPAQAPRRVSRPAETGSAPRPRRSPRSGSRPDRRRGIPRAS